MEVFMPTNFQSFTNEILMSKDDLKDAFDKENLTEIENKKLIQFFTNKKYEVFCESKIPSIKQIYYLADLLNQLHDSIESSKNVVLLKRIKNFRHNEHFNQYYLKPRKKFININSNIEVNIICNAINNTINILNTTNNTQDCLKSIKVIDQYFIFKLC